MTLQPFVDLFPSNVEVLRFIVAAIIGVSLWQYLRWSKKI